MSYRELRNFTETLKLLGYSSVISIESFRKPNFPLLAEILIWLIKRFDFDVEIELNIETPTQRIEFIKNVVLLANEKANIKLNVKKLYQADGYAVQEMLKLVNLLFKSTQAIIKNQFDENIDVQNKIQLNSSQIQSKLNELKGFRQIVTEITMQGAELFDMLIQETEIRSQRNFVLSSAIQLNEMEKKLQSTIKMTKRNIESINYKIDNVAQDELNLDKKIEIKTQELEICTQRLQHLKTIRPPFQDELDKLENELEQVYDEYVTKYQCLIYLENQLEELEKHELDTLNWQEQDIAEQAKLNSIGELELDEEAELKDENYDDLNNETKLDETNLELNKNKLKKKLNNKQPEIENVEDKIEDSLDESFDLDENIDEDDDENSDLDSEDEIELMNLSNNKSKDEDKYNTYIPNDNSDNDF